jgi:ABC-type uncharacterized transport system auxiliary subunit
MWQSAAALAVIGLGASCIRGSLPAREYYRLAPPDSVALVRREAVAPPLAGSITIAHYDTPGIYGTGGIVYRVGVAQYGSYPSREWAIPLGEMLGTLTESVMRVRPLTSDQAVFDPGVTRGEEYAWRGAVREFDEVDEPGSVSAAVSLAVQLVRVADDSVVWSGFARAVEPVAVSRSMDSVVQALSTAAARVVARLVDDAATALRAVAASRAQSSGS